MFFDTQESQDPPRVLIVDDDPADAELTRLHLGEIDRVAFEAKSVLTLQDAERELQEARYDLVILDLNLGDSAGLDTLRRIRRVSDAPVVVVSGVIDKELHDAALREGAHEVMSKSEMTSRLFALSVLYVIERNRAEERSSHLLKLLEANPEAVLLATHAGRVLFVNTAAEKLFGRSREELESEPLLFSSNEGDAVELRIHHPAGEKIGEMRLVELDYRGEQATLATVRDVTEQKKLEMQVMISDRMVAIGSLAAGVAHEINNPLASVLANLEIAARDLATLSGNAVAIAEVIESLDDAREGADRVRQIVRDLRTFSRSEEDTHEAIDVHRVIDSSLRMAHNEIRHRAEVVKDFGQTPACLANEARLGQVILNLLVNAAQAIEEGDIAGNEIRITTGTNSSGQVEIQITDTGSGIPEHIRDKLFNPFFTTKPAGMGTGLGLPICHRIVTQFGGTLAFDSEVGKGTCFTITLPATDHAAERLGKRAKAQPKTDTRRARVLVIDDESLIIGAVSRILRTGHEVTGLEDASEALELVKQGAEFDVVLCDLMMPQMTGAKFYEALGKIDSSLQERVIFMTGGAFTASSKQFLESVPNRRVEKPFDVGVLKSLISDLLG